MRVSYSSLWASGLLGLVLSTATVRADGAGFLGLQTRVQDEVPAQILPTCAIPCLLGGIATSGCNATDSACLCASRKYNDEATHCITQACTIKEALLTKNITQTSCHAPIRDKSELLSDITITLGVITAVFVVLRLVYKVLVTKSGMGGDDWLILATLIIGIPSTVIGIHGTVANGLGKDVWTLPYEKITSFGRFFFVMEVLYFAQASMLKASLLYFYLRIFPDSKTRWILWGTMAFNAAYAFSFVMAAIFSCSPVHYFWTKWDGEHEGSCININIMGWSHAAISIALDVWMLAIPLSQLPGLQLHWKKKVGVAIMFIIGTFVTVVSIMRLQSLLSFANSTNPTYDNWDVTNWSTIEINIGIICACLPTIRLFLVRTFPMLNSSRHTSNNNYYGKKNTGGSFQLGPTSRSVVESGRPGVLSNANGHRDGDITYQKSFTVQYSQRSDSDEASLVNVRDIEARNNV